MKLMSETISALAKALVDAQKEMGNAVKDSKNPFFKSKYADLNAVREAVLPAMNKNGISVLQPTVWIDGKKFVQTIFLHESGEFTSGLTEILSAKELDAQAQGSGISYARRYGLQSMANIGADDDDGEAAVNRGSKQSSPTPAPEKKAETPAQETKKEEKKEPEAPARRSFRNNKPTTGSEDL